MENDSNRNMMLFIVIAAAILMFYQLFVLGPEAKRREALAQAQSAAAATQQPAAAQAQTPYLSHAQAIANAPRVKVDTPNLTGSISLVGARIDDISLKHYHQSLDPNSPMVQLFAPAGTDHAWYAEAGWQGQGVAGAPNDQTLWAAQPGAVLTPQTPLVLTYDNGQGLKFTRTIAVDQNYMFTISDQVTNGAAAPVSLAQNAETVQVLGDLNKDPTLARSGLVHEGAIGFLGGVGGGKYSLELDKYASWKKKDGPTDLSSVGGWLGITEKYWLSALIPDQSTPISAEFRVQPNGASDFYQAGYVGQMHTLAPGASLTQSVRLFAGAKTVPLLRSYEYSGAAPKWFWETPAPKPGGVPRFDQAVDWGHFFFLTQPLFDLLEFFNRLLGSIALSILALTVLVKLVFFPLANKSYESMSKMRKIQPMVEDLKKKFGEDQAKLQQETMALYQREKINPMVGCLPMLLQIPVFYSLYKVLTVTIELRQAPFYGWIHDLSARDPTNVWNLFGLIPWSPAHTPLIGALLDGQLHIGAWPLIYGFTMWLSSTMSPPSTDPTQRMMYQLMPIVFTFIMAPYTVGLLIYWTWSNLLTILQQYVIMRRYKVDNPIDDFLGRFIRPKPKAAV